MKRPARTLFKHGTSAAISAAGRPPRPSASSASFWRRDLLLARRLVVEQWRGGAGDDFPRVNLVCMNSGATSASAATFINVAYLALNRIRARHRPGDPAELVADHQAARPAAPLPSSPCRMRPAPRWRRRMHLLSRFPRRSSALGGAWASDGCAHRVAQPPQRGAASARRGRAILRRAPERRPNAADFAGAAARQHQHMRSFGAKPCRARKRRAVAGLKPPERGMTAHRARQDRYGCVERRLRIRGCRSDDRRRPRVSWRVPAASPTLAGRYISPA